MAPPRLGIAPITFKCLRRGEAPPHIGAAKPQIIAPTETGVFAQRSAACRMADQLEVWD